ncbi:peptidoglycan-binding protein, partial [Paracoccaceae bacterium]|nr:peptidoglycan-binding protein [Paracoccaceae bacterium]
GDGDGFVSIKTSAPDALMSGANMLKSLGWRTGEPWLQEVILPSDLDWSLTGLNTEKTGQEWQRLGVKSLGEKLQNTLISASIILPQGRFGPAFIVYPNFRALLEWNQSFIYVTTAAYFATLLEGSARFTNVNAEPGLDADKMKALQSKLVALGYDVGKIDGILGAKTRAAVQNVQQEIGMPADAWPTTFLLERL